MTPESDYNLIQTSRRFFGYALKHTANDLYEHANKPEPYQLGAFVTAYVTQKAIDNDLFTQKELEPVELLFSAALDNTQALLMQEIHARHVPLELIPLIARDERTINSIGRLAMHGEDFMRTILDATASRRYFRLSEDMLHINTSDNLVDAVTGGCPFALSSERTLSPDPLFKRTIHLAGDLTYLAHKK